MRSQRQLCPKRFILKMNPVIKSAFFSPMKRKLGKEKSSRVLGMKNCRKFFRNGSKNHNSSLASLARQTGDFCLRHCSEFLTVNYSYAGLLLKKKIKFYSEPNYTYDKLFKFILDSSAPDVRPLLIIKLTFKNLVLSF